MGIIYSDNIEDWSVNSENFGTGMQAALLHTSSVKGADGPTNSKTHGTGVPADQNFVERSVNRIMNIGKFILTIGPGSTATPAVSTAADFIAETTGN